MKNSPSFHSDIWLDEAQPENPFVAEHSYCCGYNLSEQIIPNASICDYWLLLFTGKKPSSKQSRLLEIILVSLANLGPRSETVRAAMNAGVGGSTSASFLIASLSVGAGQNGGAREVYTLVSWFIEHQLDLIAWKKQLHSPNSNFAKQSSEREDIWDPYNHTPGFEQHGVRTPQKYVDILELLARESVQGDESAVAWLLKNKTELETHCEAPIGLPLIVASVLFDLGFSAEKAELLFLVAILPGAAVHALEAKQQGWRQFPFFGSSIELEDDPGQIAPLPSIEGLPE